MLNKKKQVQKQKKQKRKEEFKNKQKRIKQILTQNGITQHHDLFQQDTIDELKYFLQDIKQLPYVVDPITIIIKSGMKEIQDIFNDIRNGGSQLLKINKKLKQLPKDYYWIGDMITVLLQKYLQCEFSYQLICNILDSEIKNKQQHIQLKNDIKLLKQYYQSNGVKKVKLSQTGIEAGLADILPYNENNKNISNTSSTLNPTAIERKYAEMEVNTQKYPQNSNNSAALQLKIEELKIEILKNEITNKQVIGKLKNQIDSIVNCKITFEQQMNKVCQQYRDILSKLEQKNKLLQQQLNSIKNTQINIGRPPIDHQRQLQRLKQQYKEIKNKLEQYERKKDDQNQLTKQKKLTLEKTISLQIVKQVKKLKLESTISLQISKQVKKLKLESTIQLQISKQKIKAKQVQIYNFQKHQISKVLSPEFLLGPELAFWSPLLLGYETSKYDKPKKVYIQQRNYLLQTLEEYTKRKVKRTKMLYSYDNIVQTNFHMYVDNIPKYVVIMKLNNGCIIAAYSENGLVSGSGNKGPGFIASLTNRTSTYIESKIQGARTTNYNQYYMIFGNDQFRFQPQKREVTCLVGYQFSFYRPKLSPKDFLGVQSETSQFVSYQVHKVVFDCDEQ